MIELAAALRVLFVSTFITPFSPRAAAQTQ